MHPPTPNERLPLARSTGLSVDDVGGEILVFDRDTDMAHCLTETAALVWRACDGKTTIEALTDRGTLDAETVQRALDELGELGLLDGGPLHVQQAGRGISRRQAVGRLAAAAVGPLVVSVAAPAAWAGTSVRSKSSCGGGPKTCASGSVACVSCGPCGTACPPGTPTSPCTTGGSCTDHCCPVGFACRATGDCIKNF